MAKQIFQAFKLNSGIDAILFWVERVAQRNIGAKARLAITTLAVYARGRHRREAVESFVPRKSHEDERRLELERFLYW